MPRVVRLRALLAAASIAPVVAVSACSVSFGSGSSPRTPASASPRTPGSASGAAPAPAPAGVPMTVLTRGQSVLETVPVYVDGHGPFTFMLDTGSSISSVSAKLASRLHLRKTGQNAQVAGVTGTSQAPMVAIPRWRLGSYRLSPEPVAVLTSNAGPVDGLLGSDELRHFGTVTIAFAQNRLLLSRP